MNIKIEYVAAVSNTLRMIFEPIQPQLEIYNPYFTEDYLNDVWKPAIDDAVNMVPTKGLMNESKKKVGKRNENMVALTPIIPDLEYKIGVCIDAGTITDSLESFGLSDFKKSISKREFDKFHLAFELVNTQVNLNKVALIAKGFTQPKITNIKTLHDNAWQFEQERKQLDKDVNDLSVLNSGIIDKVLAEDTKVIKVIKAYAESTSNKELAKSVTWNALLRQVRPTPEKKILKKKLKEGASILIKTKMDTKNILQLTLLTDVKVIIYRTDLKTNVSTEGTELPFNELWEGKKEDIPGTGEYIKLTNLNTLKKAVVKCFELDIQIS